MDAIATFGAMVITEGANSADVVATQVVSAHQRQAIDTVFASYSTQAAPPLPVTLMVVASCTKMVHDIAKEAVREEETESDKTPQEILAEQQPIR